MLDRIIHFSIHNKLIIGLLMLTLIGWGSYSITQLPIDAVPDITNNQVQVLTVSPSLAAQEVERLITFPVETTMSTIPDVEEIRSFSRFGLSVVTIVFKDNIDVYWARQQVSERLKQVSTQIPAGIGNPELAPVSTGLGEIYQYALYAKKGYENKFTAMELRTIQDWIVRRQLLGTPGVADISSFGGYLKQYEIAIDPQKLRSTNVSIAEIFTALSKNNQNTGGAYIDKKPNAYFIRSQGLVTNLEDIGKIVVKNNPSGIPVLIRDVATVGFGHATRYGAMTRNTDGEVVGGLVLMLKGANSSKVIKSVKERIAIIEKTLPEGVILDPFLDRTKLVNNAIGTVTKNLAEGALIVIFVLVLLLGNLRAGLVVASVIPLSMLFAISMMNVFGVSGNLMSLGAIDFGLIVDGAVIIVESIVHRITTLRGLDKLDQAQMDEEVYQASTKIRSSAAFGEIIILIVYLPILALVGVEGKMFGPMAQTVSFAILGAFILSLTYVPMMSALMLSKKTVHKPNVSDKIMDFFQRVYAPIIRFALKWKITVVLTSVILLAVSLFIFSRLGGEFIPTLDEGDFAVETRVLVGSSLSETIDAAQKASGILRRNFPEIKQVVAKIGSAEIPTDPMPVEAGDLMIILKDKSEWTSAASRDELAEKMAKALSVIPGVTFGFQQPIQMRFNELMTGARQDVVLKIYGEDLDLLSENAAQIGKLIKPIIGVQDLYVEEVTGLPQILVNFNRDKIAQFGLNIEDINRVIRTAFAGESAGQVYEGEKRFDLVVRLSQQNRRSLQDVENLYVSAPNGNQIPLSQLAEVSIQNGPNQIQRDDTKRSITIGFNVRNRDVESIVGEIRSKIEQGVKLSPGYYISYGGQFENLIEARNRLSIAVPVALLLIFVLLYFTFHSIKQSLLIFSAIPLSAIGGILALWIRDMPFSISAGVGFIALFGVAVLNGIVLIGYFNQLRAEGLADLKEIILRGTAVRLRPVIMTALVASMGFLPMALSNTSGAEVQKPLATVVIGGLISATLLTLVVLPVLYLIFTKKEMEESLKRSNSFNPAIKGLLLFAGMIFSGPLFSQMPPAQPLTLEKAIDLALRNNAGIRSANYEIGLQKALKKTASEVSKTTFTLQRGQNNSLYTDNNLTVTQDIPFPTIWARQAALAKANVRSSELRLSIGERELINWVKMTWYQLVFLEAKRKQVLRQDSLFTGFARAANLRYKTGESNLLEKAAADLQAVEGQTLLTENQADIEIYYSQLQTLLNTEETLHINENSLPKRPINPNALTLIDSLGNTNPSLILARQLVEVSGRNLDLERQRLLPDFRVGYFNQSLIGFQNTSGTPGAPDQFFDARKRFTGFTVGVAIPLWFRPQAARIQAAGLGQKVAQANAELAQRNWQGQYVQALQQYHKYRQSVELYEQNALPQAELFLQNAQIAFQEGDIGYVEYLQGLNRALGIQSAYLDILNQYNQAVIAIEWLTGSN